MNDFSRIAVVTGASRGIGRAIALELSEDKLLVYVNFVGPEEEKEAHAVVAEIESKGGKAKAICFDVSKPNEVCKAFEEVVVEAGGVDVLVNNAGISIDSLLMRAKDEDWKTIVDVNLGGVFLCTRAALRSMLRRQNHGRIISLSSLVGQMGNAGQSMYAATKAGIMGFTKSIAREVAARQITVNAVAPGFVRTKMTDLLTAQQREALLQTIPLGRWAEAQEIASLVRFLASEKASYITGQVIAINGGMYV